MTKERLILAFVAIIAGLLLASSIFYFYQQTGPNQMSKTPTPTAISMNGKMLLELESPENDSITSTKTATIKGKSQPGALIIITTNTDDFALNANTDGTFTNNGNQIIFGSFSMTKVAEDQWGGSFLTVLNACLLQSVSPCSPSEITIQGNKMKIRSALRYDITLEKF